MAKVEQEKESELTAETGSQEPNEKSDRSAKKKSKKDKKNKKPKKKDKKDKSAAEETNDSQDPPASRLPVSADPDPASAPSSGLLGKLKCWKKKTELPADDDGDDNLSEVRRREGDVCEEVQSDDSSLVLRLYC